MPNQISFDTIVHTSVSQEITHYVGYYLLELISERNAQAIFGFCTNNWKYT